jgi:hypothetical protein
MRKKFVFTIGVHNAEYTEDFNDYVLLNNGEEQFGELTDVEAVIDYRYIGNQKELDEHIQY